MPIPAPHRKFLTRPPQPTTTTPPLDDVMAHLNAINQPNTKETATEPESLPADQTIESNLSSPTTSLTTESESEDSTESTTFLDDNQSTTSDSSLASTTSDRHLRSRYPISYNETLLTRLNGILQMRTLNKLSIPLLTSDSDSEDTPEDDENYEQSENSTSRQ